MHATIEAILAFILREYEVRQIVPEFMQNADDARATEISFTIDARTNQPHGLFVFNNALFEAEDWDSLSSTFKSKKKENLLTTGKFGIGFRSCFHMTDTPVVVSGSTLVVFDPCGLLKISSEDEFRYSDYFSGSAQLPAQIRHILGRMDRVAGFDRTRKFSGTLFYLPFRTQPSPLVKDILNDPTRKDSVLCTPASVTRDFQGLIEVSPTSGCTESEMHRALLFLKNVNTITFGVLENVAHSKILYTGTRNCTGHKVGVLARKQTERTVPDMLANMVNIHGAEGFKSMLKTPGKVNEISRYTMEVTVGSECKRYLVVSVVDSTHTAKFAQKHNETALPWMAVAAEVDGSGRPVAVNGRVSVFLPLPPSAGSGLPVHLNGTFTLTSNRRHLEENFGNSGGNNNKKGGPTWNEVLVRGPGARAYAELMAWLCAQSGPDAYFPVWPLITDNHWLWDRAFVPAILGQVLERAIPIGQLDGKKVSWAHARFPDYTTNQQLWEGAHDALTAAGFGHVTVPHAIYGRMARHYPDRIGPCISPRLARDFIRHRSVSTNPSHALLEYLISDEPIGREMYGIRLIPLADGSMGEFKKLAAEGSSMGEFKKLAAEGNHVLIPSSHWSEVTALFPPATASRLIADNLPSSITTYLRRLANQNTANITIFSPQWLAAEYRRLQSATQIHPVLQKWLDYMEEQSRADPWAFINHYRGLEFIPTEGTLLVSPAGSVPVFSLAEGGNQALIGVLRRVFTFHMAAPKYTVPAAFTNPLSPHNIVSLAPPTNPSPVLTGEESKLLSLFLMSVPWTAAEVKTTKVKSILSTLPILPTFLPGVFVCPQDATLPPSEIPTAEFHKLPREVLPHSMVDAGGKNCSFTPQQEMHVMGLCRFVVHSQAMPCVTWVNDHALLAIKNQSVSGDKAGQVIAAILGILDRTHSQPLKGFLQTEKWLPTLAGGLGRANKMTVSVPPTLTWAKNQLAENVLDSGHLPAHEHTTCLHVLTHQLGMGTVLPSALFVRLIGAASTNQQREPLLRYWADHVRTIGKPTEALQHKWLPATDGNAYTRREMIPGHHKYYGDLVRKVCSVDLSANQHTALLQALDWQSPSSHVIVQQLQAMAGLDPISRKHEIETRCHQIYHAINNGSIPIGGLISAGLPNMAWHWTGSKFVKSAQVVVPPAYEQSEPLPNMEPVYHIGSNSLARSHAVKLGANIFQDDVIHKYIEELSRLTANSGLDDNQLKNVTRALRGVQKTEGRVWRLPTKGMHARLVETDGLYFGNGPAPVVGGKEPCHPTVDEDLALRFGVRTSQSMSLEQNSIAIPMEMHIDYANLVRHLAEDYGEPPSLLKEMLQNADDALATQMDIVLDLNGYPTHSVLSPGLKKTQGPSLLFINNKEFSDADLQNICTIAGRGKINQTTAIGRFGVGVNTVYMVTDLLQLVTRDLACFFDPNKTHVDPTQNATLRAFRLSMCKRSYPDQLAPFEAHVGGALADHHTGTIIRLPLRTKEQAKESKISDKVISPAEIEQILRDFVDTGKDCLLFLRNLRQVSVKVIDVGGTVRWSAKVEAERKKSGPELGSVADIYMRLSGAKPNSNLVMDGMDDVILTSRAHGGRSVETPYRVYSVLRMDTPFRAKFPPKLGERHLPLAQVAYPLDPRHLPNMEGRVFCGLPLPLTHSMPVHINAPFALASNRRDILLDERGREHGHIWNQHLLMGPLCEAYIQAVLQARDLSHQFHLHLLPAISPENKRWFDFATSVCKQACSRSIFARLLPSSTDTAPLGHSGWHPGNRNHTLYVISKRDPHPPLLHFLAQEKGLCLYEIPRALHARGVDMGLPIKSLDSSSVAAFYRAQASAHSPTEWALDQCPFPSLKTAGHVTTIARFVGGEDWRLLEGTPLLLIGQDTLAIFGKGQKPRTITTPTHTPISLRQCLRVLFDDKVSRLRLVNSKTLEFLGEEGKSKYLDALTWAHVEAEMEHSAIPSICRQAVEGEVKPSDEDLRVLRSLWLIISGLSGRVSTGLLARWRVVVARNGQGETMLVTPSVLAGGCAWQAENSALADLRVTLARLGIYQVIDYVRLPDAAANCGPPPIIDICSFPQSLLAPLELRKQRIGSLSGEECDHLLRQFLACNLQRYDASILASLPLFPKAFTNPPTRTAISSGVVLLPPKLASLPITGLAGSNTPYFLYRPEFINLYQRFGATSAPSPAQFFTTVVSVAWSTLSENDKNVLLDFIKHHQHSLLADSQFKAAWKNVAFVRVASGGYAAPSAVYDPTLAQLGEPRIPLAPFNAPDWLEILRNLGMRVIVSPVLFLQLAQNANTIERGAYLYQYLVTNVATLTADANINSQLVTVKFIPAQNPAQPPAPTGHYTSFLGDIQPPPPLTFPTNQGSNRLVSLSELREDRLWEVTFTHTARLWFPEAATDFQTNFRMIFGQSFTVQPSLNDLHRHTSILIQSLGTQPVASWLQRVYSHLDTRLEQEKDDSSSQSFRAKLANRFGDIGCIVVNADPIRYNQRGSSSSRGPAREAQVFKPSHVWFDKTPDVVSLAHSDILEGGVKLVARFCHDFGVQVGFVTSLDFPYAKLAEALSMGSVVKAEIVRLMERISHVSNDQLDSFLAAVQFVDDSTPHRLPDDSGHLYPIGELVLCYKTNPAHQERRRLVNDNEYRYLHEKAQFMVGMSRFEVRKITEVTRVEIVSVADGGQGLGGAQPIIELQEAVRSVRFARVVWRLVDSATEEKLAFLRRAIVLETGGLVQRVVDVVSGRVVGAEKQAKQYCTQEDGVTTFYVTTADAGAAVTLLAEMLQDTITNTLTTAESAQSEVEKRLRKIPQLLGFVLDKEPIVRFLDTFDCRKFEPREHLGSLLDEWEAEDAALIEGNVEANTVVGYLTPSNMFVYALVLGAASDTHTRVDAGSEPLVVDNVTLRRLVAEGEARSVLTAAQKRATIEKLDERLRGMSADEAAKLRQDYMRRLHIALTNDISEESHECSVCLELLARPTVLPCGHCFCLLCVRSLPHNNSLCPLCCKPCQPNTQEEFKPFAELLETWFPDRYRERTHEIDLALNNMNQPQNAHVPPPAPAPPVLAAVVAAAAAVPVQPNVGVAEDGGDLGVGHRPREPRRRRNRGAGVGRGGDCLHCPTHCP